MLGLLGTVTTDHVALQREVDGMRAHLLRAVTIASGAGMPSPILDQSNASAEQSQPPTVTSAEDNKDTIENEDLIGASKSELAVQALLDRGCALKTNEIVDYFREVGREDWSEGAGNSSLAKALRRRAAHTGDIFELPGKPTRWDLVARYKAKDLARLLSDEAFAQDREREMQRRRTKEGLQRARDERGFTPGPKVKFSREQGIEIQQMLKAKQTAATIAKKYDVSPRTVYLWSKRLKNWNPETDDWPPPPVSSKSDDEEPESTPSLRLVSNDD